MQQWALYLFFSALETEICLQNRYSLNILSRDKLKTSQITVLLLHTKALAVQGLPISDIFVMAATYCGLGDQIHHKIWYYSLTTAV